MGADQMVKVQLWDCSGNLQYQSFWSALCKVRSITAPSSAPAAVRLPLLLPVAAICA
jgi:hypothetical protein